MTKPRRVQPPVVIKLPNNPEVNWTTGELVITDRQLNNFYDEVKRHWDRKQMRKSKSRVTRLNEAVDQVLEAKQEIEDIKFEIEQWKENLEGTNFEGTLKYEMLEECLDGLEEVFDQLDEVSYSDGDIVFPGMFD
jgi:hypothetical protein|tara:strand:- start:2944 stop:3348 length:405 start_codon:yes stop_codon:yes gene_type:complete